MALDREKYDEDLMRGREIGDILKYKISEVFGSKEKITKIFSSITGLKYSTALTTIGQYCKGINPHNHSSASSLVLRKKTQEHLRKLSGLYLLLEIQDSNILLKEKRRINMLVL